MAGERGAFVVEITPGNAAMQEGGHVAEALRKLAGKLDFQEAWEGEGAIQDANGNTVGRWTFHDFNAGDDAEPEPSECPNCGSEAICEQTREDQEPWACLDCSHEWDAPRQTS